MRAHQQVYGMLVDGNLPLNLYQPVFEKPGDFGVMCRTLRPAARCSTTMRLTHLRFPVAPPPKDSAFSFLLAGPSLLEEPRLGSCPF